MGICLVVAPLELNAMTAPDRQVTPAPLVPASPEPRHDAVTPRTTIRATRLTEPLRLDGRLDEQVYSTVRPVTDFVQMEPRAGAPATEQTDMWIFVDEQRVYVTFRCWESHPERMVVNEMRRDNSRLWLGDNVAFMFDTFHDRRNGVEFGIAPSGGRYDGQFTNERWYNGDWNPVWEVAVSSFEGGWVAEAAIPFRSLRYPHGREQVWGFQARRINAWKNELSFLTALPPELGMGRGIFAASLAPTLVGIQAPLHRAVHLDLKPYARTAMATDRDASPAIENVRTGDIGLDAKYGMTDNLAADLTVRPDFAQVEADEAQINLTRFNLFFPEKREFFLENAGVFTFGNQVGGDMPTMFYSRRIGLNQGHAVTIDGGGRVTGKVGGLTIGALDIQSAGDYDGRPSTNYAAVRLKRDVLQRSTIGLIATSRSTGDLDNSRPTTYGVDGTFALSPMLTLNTYWAKTTVAGLAQSDDISYRGQLDYIGDRYGLQIERLVVGSHFDPALGFVPRPDMRKTAGALRFSPRPRGRTRVRKWYLNALGTYITDSAGLVETRDLMGEFAADLQNGDHFTTQHEHDTEFIPRPFTIARGMTFLVGSYQMDTSRLGYTFGPRRRFSGSVLIEHGAFYGGQRSAFSLSSGRVNVGLRLSAEPSYSVTNVRLPTGEFTASLLGSRATFTLTPELFVSTLVQYSSSTHTVSTNARLRWEYRPGSELFLVYNDGRNTLATPMVRSRALVLKVNRLFRP